MVPEGSAVSLPKEQGLPSRLPRIAALSASALLLGGCFPAENYGPVQISTTEGDLVLAICETGSIDSLEVLQLPPGGDRTKGWELLWLGAGPRAVTEGDQIVASTAPQGFSQASFAEVFKRSEGHEYQVTIQLEDGSTYGPVFKAPVGGLTEGAWLTSTGRVGSTRCG